MKQKSSITWIALLLAGWLNQAAAADVVTVDSYQPAFESTTAFKAVRTEYPRLPVSHSVVLGSLKSSSEVLKKTAIEAQAGQPGVPLQTGFDRRVETLATAERMQDLLRWQPGPMGGESAALRLVSPDASANRVILEVERLHAAAVVRFISELSGEIVSVTGEEIINTLSLNQDQGRQYVGPTLEGDSVVVEVHLPVGIRPEDTKISITGISHIYMDNQEVQAFLTAADQSCMVSSTCYPEYELDSAAVAAISFNKNGLSYVCSGTLLNDVNTTFTSNFVTANHCINSQSVASTLESYWFYKASSCYGNNIDSRAVNVRGGADLLFTQQSTDTTLLRLRGTLPRGVAYQGWTTAEVVSNLPVSILHHPDFSHQKITRGTIASFANCDVQSGEDEFVCSWMLGSMGTGSFIRVQNSMGAVIGGSSGSGLLVNEGGGQRYYVGTLLGGGASCSKRTGSDYYGRFDIAYKAGLGAWLNQEPVAVDSQLGAIYRLYNTALGTHFYTASAAERDSVLKQYPVFVYERTAFYTYSHMGDNLSPVHRFYNKATGAHFYTISQQEKESVERQYSHFIYEGAAWYAATLQTAGSLPLYRFYNDLTGTHFYTTDAAEKDYIIATYPSYIYEGIAYYVWPGH